MPRLPSPDDASGWSTLEPYAERVTAFFQHRVEDEHDVDDLAQETLLAAWLALPGFRGDSSPCTWLLGIAKRKLWNHYRDRSRRVGRLVPLDDNVVDSAMDDGLEDLALELALDGLSTEDRMLHARFYRQRSGVRAIARYLGIPEGTVRYRLLMLRRKLRHTVEYGCSGVDHARYRTTEPPPRRERFTKEPAPGTVEATARPRTAAPEVIMYRSTRSDVEPVPASRALLAGLAPDRGLFVPTEYPRLSAAALDPNCPLSYAELALDVLGPYFPEFETSKLGAVLSAAAARFDTADVAPLVEAGGVRYLELFHGPTLAFKDLALTAFGGLLSLAREAAGMRGELLVLTATSGDTGKAALAGLAGVPGVRVAVFYPMRGVSPIQRLMMTTHDAPGAAVIAVEGTFDDAQRGVKELFGSPSARARLAALGLVPSSANSINVGRLLPQVVYYVAAWRELSRNGALNPGQALDVAVPTGNFGDILAARYAKAMGLPLGRLAVASNRNAVVADFFGSGIYDRNRPFHVTDSPSMDILVSSNLERLLFEASGRDAARTADLMRDLSASGRYEVSAAERAAMADFAAGTADDDAAADEIGRVFRQTGYLMDPHTATASAVRRNLVERGQLSENALVVSTASPFKFPAAVARAIGLDAENVDEIELAARLAERAGLALPPQVGALRTLPVRHTVVVPPQGMEAALFRFAEGGAP